MKAISHDSILHTVLLLNTITRIQIPCTLLFLKIAVLVWSQMVTPLNEDNFGNKLQHSGSHNKCHE